MDKRILLGCPLGGTREWILPYYLDRITRLDFDKKKIILCFIINNIFDNSLKILNKFKDENKDKYLDIIIETYKTEKFKDDRIDELRESKTYNLLSSVRNLLFKKCAELNCTHYMSIDSDILVPPTLLNDLLNVDKPVVASLIYNGYLHTKSIDKAYLYPNILKYIGNNQYTHVVNFYVKNPDKSPKDKILEIDATGACCLISREVCENTYYKWHKQGEDLGWADVCREKGYKMTCLPNAYSQHIMSPDLLDQFKYFGL